MDGKKPFVAWGRITIIQSCVSHISNYFLSLFKALDSIASKLKKLKRGVKLYLPKKKVGELQRETSMVRD